MVTSCNQQQQLMFQSVGSSSRKRLLTYTAIRMSWLWQQPQQQLYRDSNGCGSNRAGSSSYSSSRSNSSSSSSCASYCNSYGSSKGGSSNSNSTTTAGRNPGTRRIS